VGVYNATIVVVDEGGLSDDLNISVRVRNVVDPPLPPIILSPANHSTVEEGATVTFRVRVSDPDIPFGEWPNVVIISNRSGVIRTIRTNDTVEYTVGLPAGEHRITVVVSDGFYSSQAWIQLTVKGEPDPGPGPQAGGGDEVTPASVAASIVLFAITFAGGRYHDRWRKRRAEEG
jgi:hypothetical protein